jgi:hypothetical protein
MGVQNWNIPTLAGVKLSLLCQFGKNVMLELREWVLSYVEVWYSGIM